MSNIEKVKPILDALTIVRHRTSLAVSVKKKKERKTEKKEGTIACRFSRRCIVGGKVDAFLRTRTNHAGLTHPLILSPPRFPVRLFLLKELLLLLF